MDAGPGCFVAGCLALVLRLSRFVGVAPLSFVKEKGGYRVFISPRWTVYGYCYFICLVLFTVGTLIADTFQSHNALPYDFGRVTGHVMITSVMLISGRAVFGAPSRMRSMIACVNHLQKINRKLNIPQWPTSKSTERKKICIFITWTLTIISLEFIDKAWLLNCEATNNNYSTRKQDNTRTHILHCLLLLFHWIIMMQLSMFVMITQQVVYSFEASNKILRRVLNETAPPCIRFDGKEHVMQFTGPKPILKTEFDNYFNNVPKVIPVSERVVTSRRHHEIIHSLTAVYVSTCAVVQEVDRCFGLLVLVLLVIFLMQQVAILYSIITALFEMNTMVEGSWMNLRAVVMQIILSFCNISNLVVIIEPPHKTHVEMELTRELVSQLLYCAPSAYEPLAVELQLFSRHLMLHQVSYSPMKVATLKRSLVVTVFSSVIAYLVILVQLQGTALSTA